MKTTFSILTILFLAITFSTASPSRDYVILNPEYSGKDTGNGKMDCEVWFTYEPSQYDTIHFIAVTIPVTADYYFWDFGDGTTGTGQETDHLFNPLLGNSFIVSLTTTTYDSITQDSCVAQYSEEVLVYNGGGDCINYFEYSTNDSVTFTFYGYSLPEAFIYEWDFGDGTTGEGQTVEHTFDPLMGNSFEVSLSTLSADSLTLDTCFAFSVQTVFVVEPPQCEAFFTYEQDPADPFTFMFFDASTGDIDDWEWWFSDSTYYTGQNPVHTFQQPGEYLVCLSVFSDSILCDTYCELVIVEDEPLIADFTYELDSLSQIPNKYHFFDASSGGAENWFWDFGDGMTSLEMSPVHIYSNPGSYLVCLEVTKENGTVVSSVCESVLTPEYFDFGGVTYLGELPMNNSGTNNDTAVAFLYRKYNGNYVPYDTLTYFQYGYYWFSQVLEGEYIVKVGLTDNSMNYDNFVPSYYENSLFWEDADPIVLIDSNNYALEIHLPEAQQNVAGNGSVGGYIAVDDDCAGSVDISGIIVLLFDSNNSIFRYTETDINGNWSFDNLPLDAYSIYAEKTAFYHKKTDVVLNESNYIADNVELKIYCDNQVGYDNYQITSGNLGNIYPNPVSSELNIEVNIKKYDDITLEIYSVTGQKILSKLFSSVTGESILTLNTDFLPKGSYLLSVTSKNGDISAFRKFIK